jgi:ubiquinone/menaquinone biosynthesis C-methylase UbiE
MKLEEQVAAYYTRDALEERILEALRSAGKNPERLCIDDLALLDNLHVGGGESTEALAAFMDLRPDMQLLDVGCGIGGPARYFSGRGCQVTGIDLSEEFVRVARSLTRMLKLDGKAGFRQGSALALPFRTGTFDGAYMIHVGMNIEDKAGVFRELARVLKPGGHFTIFDIMRRGNGTFEYPLPWALNPATSFVGSVEDYRHSLQDAGFRIDHQRERSQFALDWAQRMRARSSSPVLGMHLLMGEQAPVMLKNVMTAIASGAAAPVELVATLQELML